MKYKKILVTGGAGFVGSHLCLKLKEHYQNISVTALDNLSRRGSELNVPRLKKGGVKFVKGDVRYPQDLSFPQIDLLIECSAEASVMAGINSSPEYLLQTNLVGALNCFELARKSRADVIFLSTSRVYPIEPLNSLDFIEKEKRFVLLNRQTISGASAKGISEEFSLTGVRSLYGATKLAAELILQEYLQNYGLQGAVNRFGLITGPWQMAKIDQGVVAFWMARHVFQKPLTYIGFGGQGKQVRDMLHVDDVFSIINLQLKNLSRFNGQVYNLGGGLKNSFSLLELTDACQKISGHQVKIDSVKETRPGDVRIYIADNRKINQASGWKPKKNIDQTLDDIHQWIIKNKKKLKSILA